MSIEVGFRVGNWVVIQKDSDNSRNWVVQCTCGCGQERSVRGTKLSTGIGSCSRSKRPHTGDEYGDWVVISDEVFDSRFVMCRCKGCGKYKYKFSIE